MKVGRDQPLVIDEEPAAKADLLTRSVLDIDQHDTLVGSLDQVTQLELGLLWLPELSLPARALLHCSQAA